MGTLNGDVNLKCGIVLAAALSVVGCTANRKIVRGFGNDPVTDNLRMNNTDYYLKEADKKVSMGDLKGASDDLAWAAENNPSDKRVLWRIALMAKQCRDPQVGMKALHVLVTVDPALAEDQEVLTLARDFGSMH